MAASTFPDALKLVLAHEGGYVNHPKDPGGATNFGVTQRTYNAWRKSQGQPTNDVRKIGPDEVAAIYKRQYWDAVRGDDLPPGLDYAEFDYAVNSGPSKAVKDLQRIVGSRADGIMGANTLAAVLRREPAGIVRELCDRRMAFLKSLKHWPTFKKGWTRRVNDVRAKALAWASEAPPPPDIEIDDAPITAPKADPADVAVSKTPEAIGGAITGTGAAGGVISETAQQLSPYTELSEIIKYAFLALMLAGVGLTVWALIRRMKDREA